MIEFLFVLGCVLLSIGLFLIGTTVGFLGTGSLFILVSFLLAKIKAVSGGGK